MSESFYSKILLFGEYSIIQGSDGLAIPFSKYSGVLKVGPVDHQGPLDLCEFVEYV